MAQTSPLSLEELHNRAVTTPLAKIASDLEELLTRRVIAFIADVDGKTVSRWASGQVNDIRDMHTHQRLLVTYEIAQLLLEYDSPRTVKAWFLGLNPQLDDRSPAEVLQEGRLKAVLDAARAFVAYG